MRSATALKPRCTALLGTSPKNTVAISLWTLIEAEVHAGSTRRSLWGISMSLWNSAYGNTLNVRSWRHRWVLTRRNRFMASTALSMRNFTILLASLILIVGSPVADAAGEQKPLPKVSTTAERDAKGLLTCTRDCGLRHKDPEERARCIGRAQASGQCSLVNISQ
jgi:hypothetical protein